MLIRKIHDQLQQLAQVSDSHPREHPKVDGAKPLGDDWISAVSVIEENPSSDTESGSEDIDPGKLSTPEPFPASEPVTEGSEPLTVSLGISPNSEPSLETDPITHAPVIDPTDSDSDCPTPSIVNPEDEPKTSSPAVQIGNSKIEVLDESVDAIHYNELIQTEEPPPSSESAFEETSAMDSEAESLIVPLPDDPASNSLTAVQEIAGVSMPDKDTAGDQSYDSDIPEVTSNQSTVSLDHEPVTDIESGIDEAHDVTLDDTISSHLDQSATPIESFDPTEAADEPFILIGDPAPAPQIHEETAIPDDNPVPDSDSNGQMLMDFLLEPLPRKVPASSHGSKSLKKPKEEPKSGSIVKVFALQASRHKLTIRGASPLSWDKGAPMHESDLGQFDYLIPPFSGTLRIRFFIDDRVPCSEPWFEVKAGNTIECYPDFGDT